MLALTTGAATRKLSPSAEVFQEKSGGQRSKVAAAGERERAAAAEAAGAGAR